jgi:MFS family permease
VARDRAHPFEPAAGGPTGFPPGLSNAFLFATFNALSFQMMLGSPMILYAKSLQASATVLGIIAGMMPLLVIFQIPAASHVARIGYKRFVYAGWGIRVLFIFVMALVPLTTGFLTATTQLSLLLFLLFGFNLSRGISSAGWLPWITTLVPMQSRGRYLARDATYVHIASCSAFMIAALCLGQAPKPWQFAVLFCFSGVMGAISLIFLKRVPDVHPPEQEVTAKIAVPWLAIASHPPFRKLIRLNIAWSIAYGGIATFTVAYLRAEAGMTEGSIMLVTGLAFLGGLAGLAWFESRTDRLGSKPVLTFCLAIWIAILLGWIGFAGKLVTPRFPLVLMLHLAMGFAFALVNMNQTRLAMVIAPVMGRSHFFALFTVLGNLALGISPIFWGLVIDAVGGTTRTVGGLELNRYSFFFAGALASFLVTFVLCRRLDEPQAKDIDELLFEILQFPQRLWIRLWPRG